MCDHSGGGPSLTNTLFTTADGGKTQKRPQRRAEELQLNIRDLVMFAAIKRRLEMGINLLKCLFLIRPLGGAVWKCSAVVFVNHCSTDEKLKADCCLVSSLSPMLVAAFCPLRLPYFCPNSGPLAAFCDKHVKLQAKRQKAHAEHGRVTVEGFCEQFERLVFQALVPRTSQGFSDHFTH